MFESLEYSSLPTSENRAQAFLDWVEGVRTKFRGVKIDGSMADDSLPGNEPSSVDVEVVSVREEQLKLVIPMLKSRAKLKNGVVVHESEIVQTPLGFNCSLQVRFGRADTSLPLAV